MLRLKYPTVVLAAALSFIAAFYLRLSYIPTHFWKNRDDGVITLSSAKNVVDFGFIGVSPSGEMVEAFSAPLQAFIFGICYWMSAVGYDSFLSYQGFIATALLGTLVGAFFLLLYRDTLQAILAALCAALLLLYSGNFIVWHFSGMENALTHVAIAATLAFGLRIATSTRAVHPISAAGFALLALTRIDLVLEVGCILLVATFLRIKRDSWRDSVQFLGVFFATWLVLITLKWLCLGTLLPHTASAQGINPYRNILRVLSIDGLTEIYSLISLIRERQMLYLSVVCLPLAFLVRGTPAVKSAILLLYCTIGAALFRGVIFGGARLDPVRTVSYLSLSQSMLLFTIIFSLKGSLARRLLVAVVPLLPVVAQTVESRAPFACCDSAEFEAVQCVARKIRDAHKLVRPLLANPDLGAVSFSKEFNIYDFGRLANPVLTQLTTEEEIRTHFFLLVAPDIIEITPYWRERNTAVVESPLFAERYVETKEGVDSCHIFPHHNFYIRREIALGSGSRERYLNDSLATSLSIPLLKHELERCTNFNPADCFYTARVIYRFLPDFLAAQQLGALQDMIQSSVASQLYKRFIEARIKSRSTPLWSKEYVEILREFLLWKHGSGQS